MPDLAAVLQQLGLQQPNGNPFNGQANYPTGWTGFTAGIQDWMNRTNSEQRGRVEDTRQKLLGMVQSVPDTEENAPLKMKLMLDILGAKDKHWSDKVLAPSAADAVIAQMYQMVKDKLPEAPTPPSNSPTGPSFAVSPTTPGGNLGVEIPPPPDNTGKFKFTDPGKWYDINEVFQDEESGSKFLIQIDRNTGKTRRVDLGAARTVSEINATTRAQRYAEQKKTALDKKYYELAIGLSGLGSEQQFEALPQQLKEEYLNKASGMIVQGKQLDLGVKSSTINRNNSSAAVNAATVPMRQAQTENILAQPKDPNAVTADEQRTVNALTATLDQEITRLQKIADAPRGTRTPKEIREAKEQLSELKRQRDAIRAKVIQPKARLDATRPQGTNRNIPRGNSGPVGDPNDPLGIRNR